MRLKPKDLKQHRLDVLEKQKGICPLCKTTILPEEAALDHDHDEGYVRQVLHRACNQAEGRIKSWTNRSRFQGDHKVFLKNLLEYIDTDYSDNFEHPGHLTKKCKKFKALNKDVQIEKLRKLNVVLEGKETKKQLTKLYRKAIT